MKELQKRQRIRRIIYSIPVLSLLLLVTFFMVKGSFNVLGKERQSATRLAELENKASLLALREQELEGDIERLKTDDGLEGEIRERFNVTEEGERVAIIVDPDEMASTTRESSRPWYKKLWGAIIGE